MFLRTLGNKTVYVFSTDSAAHYAFQHPTRHRDQVNYQTTNSHSRLGKTTDLGEALVRVVNKF